MVLRYLNITDGFFSKITDENTTFANNNDIIMNTMKRWPFWNNTRWRPLEDIFGVALTLNFFNCYQLAMYQVSCFYHKMHDSSQIVTYPPHFEHCMLIFCHLSDTVVKEIIIRKFVWHKFPARKGLISFLGTS